MRKDCNSVFVAALAGLYANMTARPKNKMNATSAYTLRFARFLAERTDRPRLVDRLGGVAYEDVYLPVCPIVISPGSSSQNTAPKRNLAASVIS